MDPAQCLLAALRNLQDVAHLNDDVSLRDASKADAAEHLRNLADWLDGGGFTPDVEEVTRELLSGEYVILAREEIEAVAETCEEYSPKSAAIVRGLKD
jgi:hypothetical protein